MKSHQMLADGAGISRTQGVCGLQLLYISIHRDVDDDVDEEKVVDPMFGRMGRMGSDPADEAAGEEPMLLMLTRI